MMLGTAALCMWWEVAPSVREEFEHWHSHEHFDERLSLPGFLRGSRWADAGGGDGFFVQYELATYEALFSPEYLARLNAPSEWSRRMMPLHLGMVRSQCRVLESCGASVAGHAATVRFSPSAGNGDRLRTSLHTLVQQLPGRPGISGAHLLCTDTPALAPTTEQKIRGLADRQADWILVVNGYDPQAMRQLAERELSAASLLLAGAEEDSTVGIYSLRLCATPAEARMDASQLQRPPA